MRSQPRTSDTFNSKSNRNASSYTQKVKSQDIYSDYKVQASLNGPVEKTSGGQYYGPVFFDPSSGCMTQVDSYTNWFLAADGRYYCVDDSGNIIYKSGIYGGTTSSSENVPVDISNMIFTLPGSGGGGGGGFDSSCCEDISAAVANINSHLVVVDASINYLFSVGDVSDVIVLVNDLSQNVYDNSQSIIELNSEVDDLSGVVQDLSASVHDLSGELYSLPSVVADLSGVVSDLSGVVVDLSAVVLDLSGDFNNHLTTFVDLNGVVADLSAVVLDLSGDFNTLNTAFVDLSSVVADLSAVVLDLSGDFNSLNATFVDLSGIVADLSSNKADRSGDTFTGLVTMDQGLKLSIYTPGTTNQTLYTTNGTELYWDNERLSVWDTSGTSLVLDASYDNIIIPGSTTELGVDRTNKIAYLETDLSNIKFIVQGSNIITIDNSSIDLSGTVNFSETLSANQGLKISTYTPSTTTQTLYTPNGTDLYWNGTAVGSGGGGSGDITDLSAVVHDLSTVVLDLSGDFNTLNTAFTDLSGVVTDLSTVVFNLSGDFNTISTAFTDLSGVVTDLSTVVLDLSGDFNTISTAFTDLSGVVTDLSTVVLDLSGDFNTISTAFTDLSGVVTDLSTVVLDLSGDFNTLNTAFVDLSGEVADISSVLLDLSNTAQRKGEAIIFNADQNLIKPDGVDNKSLLIQAGGNIPLVAQHYINFVVRDLTGNKIDALKISGTPNLNIIHDLEGVFNKSIKLQTFTPSSTSSMLYTTNGTDLYWNGNILGSQTVINDLSTVVLDLSGDFNTLRTAFTDLSGVVVDLSLVVLDLSGDLNTLSTSFTNLTNVVTDLSTVVLDLSGDLNTLSTSFTNLTNVVTDLSSVVLDLSGDFNTLSTAFVDLSGVVADLSGNVTDISNNKVSKSGDTMTGDLVLNTKLVLSTDANDVFITKTGTSNKSLLLQAGDDNSATNDNFAIQFNVRDANANVYNPLFIDGSNQNIIANREVIVYNQTYAVNGIRTFVNTGGSDTYPFIATGNKTGQATAKSANDIEYGFGMMYKTDGNMDILRYSGSTTGNAVMNFNRGTGDVTTEKNLSVGEGILFNSGTAPSSITNKLYRVNNDLYWDNDRISVWDESGTSLVLDASYDNIIIPGSTTKLGVDSGNNKAYLETDLSSIDLNIASGGAFSVYNGTNTQYILRPKSWTTSDDVYLGVGNTGPTEYGRYIRFNNQYGIYYDTSGEHIFQKNAIDTVKIDGTVVNTLTNSSHHKIYPGQADLKGTGGDTWYYGSGAGNGAVNDFNIVSTGGASFYHDSDGNMSISGTTYGTSDRRIKKDIQLINDDSSLELVKKIEPYTYKYIDETNRGSSVVYGFIAQQVREFFPPAIKLDKEAIPNIMKHVDISNDIITFTTETDISLNSQIKLINLEDEISNYGFNDPSYTEYNFTTQLIILKQLTSSKYQISQKLKYRKAYCVGTYVDDFHRLTKEKLLPILWSATQQVIKDKEALSTENETLKQQVTTLDQKVIDLETRLKRIEESLNLTTT